MSKERKTKLNDWMCPLECNVDMGINLTEVLLEKTLPKNNPSDIGYLRNKATKIPGISHEEMVESYNAWADTYDVDVRPGIYNGPSIAASAMARRYPCKVTRGVLCVLDVAAGTGRVGQELHNIGFKHILEPSQGMLKVLIGRGVYELTFENFIGSEKIEAIMTGSYDCLVIAGGMGEGQIPVSACDEMIRIVKPGGTILIVMREEYLSEVKAYVNKLEPYMKALEDEGLWKQVHERPCSSLQKSRTRCREKLFFWKERCGFHVRGCLIPS